MRSRRRGLPHRQQAPPSSPAVYVEGAYRVLLTGFIGLGPPRAARSSCKPWGASTVWRRRAYWRGKLEGGRQGEKDKFVLCGVDAAPIGTGPKAAGTGEPPR